MSAQASRQAALHEVAGAPSDKQAHFFVSAQLLRLTDLGKTRYGTALIGAEQVRYQGLRKELSDVGLTADQIASNLITKVAKLKMQTVRMLDDLVMAEQLDDAGLAAHLAEFSRSFKPTHMNTIIAPHSWDGYSAYGKAMMRWYGEQKCWCEQELSRQGLDASSLAADPVVAAFETLMALSKAEDRMVTSLGLDQGDLLYDLEGISSGLSRSDDERESSFKQALQARGAAHVVTLNEFYHEFLKDDVFEKTIAALPQNLASGAISAHSMTFRYVVTTNLPQHAQTVLSSESVRITYRPIKDEAWMGLVSTVVKIPQKTAQDLAQNLYQASSDDPAHPAGQAAALARVCGEVGVLYARAIKSYQSLSRQVELAQVDFDHRHAAQ